MAVAGGDRNVTPNYNWTVSAGTISNGQGTSSITIDTTAIGGMPVTATVEVGGFPPDCQPTTSYTADVEKRPTPRKIDEYGPIAIEDEKTRLDNFAIELQIAPLAQAFLIAYGGKESSPGTAAARLKTAQSHLVKTRGIAADRIVIINGGLREDPGTELWIAPQKAAPPQARPTVDPSEIRPPSNKKPAPKKPAARKKS